MAWGLGVDGRLADGREAPHRAPKALCGSCDARDGERIRSRGLSRTGVARDCGDVGSVAGWPSGREWNDLQPGQGATELDFPRPHTRRERRGNAPGRLELAFEVSAAPCSEQNNPQESTTLEPTPATCGTCKAVEGLYTLGSGFICVGCIGTVVSMAANDIWEGHVIYDKTFEDVLLS